MNDLISRQAAIDGRISVERANGVEIYSDEAVPVEYLKQLPSAEPEQHWIPNWMHHNGHEPEENDEYLVTWSGYIGNKITKPMLSICEYNDEWITEDIEKYGYNNVMIHAYMPLPEPYKEGDNG